MILSYLYETRGLRPTVTGKVLCNKLAYAALRAVGRQPPGGWLRSRRHWFRSPFCLYNEVLWSRPLQAWFSAEDEVALETMLHLPSYEPVTWVAPKPGDVFLDIGAYTGWYTIQSARAVSSSGRVIALEPDEVNRRQLERNLSLNDIQNCTVAPLAAWSKSGRTGWAPGEVSVWHRIDKVRGSTNIAATTVDDLVHTLSLSRVDWMKLDVEGAEVEALRGAEDTLRRFHPTLFIEVHETLESLQDLLAPAGYLIERAAFDQPPQQHGWIQARCP